MIEWIAPAAMIFVPSIAGVSRNKEMTLGSDHACGANILLDVLRGMAAKSN